MEAGVVSGGLPGGELLGGLPLQLPLRSLPVVVAEGLAGGVPRPSGPVTTTTTTTAGASDVLVGVRHDVLAAVKERGSASQPRASLVLRHGVAGS